jgi:hypothetical protein
MLHSKPALAEISKLTPSPAMLPPLHSDQGDQLQQHMYLSRATKAAQGGPRSPVRELWVQGLLQ